MEGSKTILSSDEKMAIIMEKYPTLYSKADPGHKDKTLNNNVWKSAAQEMGVDVVTIQRLFKNLKKRYNERRRKVCLTCCLIILTIENDRYLPVRSFYTEEECCT